MENAIAQSTLSISCLRPSPLRTVCVAHSVSGASAERTDRRRRETTKGWTLQTNEWNKWTWMHTRNVFNEPDNGIGDGYHSKAEAQRGSNVVLWICRVQCRCTQSLCIFEIPTSLWLRATSLMCEADSATSAFSVLLLRSVHSVARDRRSKSIIVLPSVVKCGGVMQQ